LLRRRYMFSKTIETVYYTLVSVPRNEKCGDRALSLPLEFRDRSWQLTATANEAHGATFPFAILRRVWIGSGETFSG